MIRHLLLPILLLLASCGKPTTIAEVVPPAPADALRLSDIPGEWTTQAGETVRMADLDGHPTLVAMIYTACPSACPRLVADMKAIAAELPEEGNHRFVLISFDPVADTPEVMTAFAALHKLDPERWTFLQGTPESVQTFAHVLGVRFARTGPVDFAHANIMSVFDAEGVLRHQQEGLARDPEPLARILKALDTP